MIYRGLMMFSIRRDGQGRLPAEFSHIGPLSGLDGLFDAMDGVLREQLQLVECLIEGEGTIGIQPQLDLMEGEALTDALHQLQLLVEVDGANLEFHTAKALFQLLFQSLEHLVVVAHPHQSIDGDAHLATTEGCVEQEVRGER